MIVSIFTLCIILCSFGTAQLFEPFVSFEQGRFPDVRLGNEIADSSVCTGPDDVENFESPDCNSYYQCVLNSDGGYSGVLRFCSTGEVFAPGHGCVASELFTCIRTTSSDSTTSTTTEYSTSTSSGSTDISDFTDPSESTTDDVSEPTPYPSEFSCTSAGRFADPEDLAKFYVCLWNGEEFTAISMSCRDGFVFNPEYGVCIAATTLPTSTTTLPSVTESCSYYDRFPDTGDSSIFYQCVSDEDGNFHLILQSCKEGLLFDPEYKVCVKSIDSDSV